MPNFTQGEWKCDFEEDKYIWSCDEEVLGELYFTTPEETKANARLIASAPKMYELLENIVFYISECQKLYSPFPHELITYADIAKQLLARIDGGEDNA